MNVSVHILGENRRAGTRPARLGRHVEHDERSRAYVYQTHAPCAESVVWPRHCAPFDQGDIGSCTGNAMAGLLMTGPFYEADRKFDEQTAIGLYELATRLDRIPGIFPPDDTGSSGLAVMKAARRIGYIQKYKHCFSFEAAIGALSVAPVIIGINWYDSFDTPVGEQAELQIAGIVRGGHELVLDMLDIENGYVGGTNSWGLGWGNRGKFVMTFGTFRRLLKERGDVGVPLAA